MKGSISVSAINFKNGTTLNLQEDSIVLFVGANNSGKSLTLREIHTSLIAPSDTHTKKFIIDSSLTSKNGSINDVLDFLEPRKTPQGQYSMYGENNNNLGTSFAEEQIIISWDPQQIPLGARYVSPVNLIGLFLKKLETQDRLNLVNPSPNISFGERATTPIQRLKQDTNAEINFSKLFRKAFKQDLIVNHDGGQTIPLHVGDRPESTKENDRVSKEYSEKIYKMGQLQTQGDGMKSFAGVFLSLFADNYSINIIDEPEAFLHPPQAKLLGEMLAKNLDQDKQLLISTHSEHFLKGMLAYGGKRLIVVRLLRDGNDTKTTVLDNEDLQKIWKEPILKHSNILDGLFHAKVVLCESEGDSRFFSAMSSALIDDANISSPDIHYVQCGGKHQFPTAINALKKLNVPLTVIGDFDLLNNQKPLEDVFVGLGGIWDDIKNNWKIVKSDIDTQRPELSSDDMKKSITEILDKITDTVVTDDDIKELESTIKKASAWGVAKRLGKRYIRAGNATQSYNRINEAFKKVGLIILEIGEIECFDLTVGNHGPKWVNKVLEKDLLASDDLKDAREFVKEHILEI